VNRQNPPSPRTLTALPSALGYWPMAYCYSKAFVASERVGVRVDRGKIDWQNHGIPKKDDFVKSLGISLFATPAQAGNDVFLPIIKNGISDSLRR